MARTPDGSKMELYRHDRDYFIRINGHELMNSRQHESELELARLGCAHLSGHPAPVVLVGGLGMGYTLRQTLDLLGQDARVVLGELMGAVVEWNRTFLQELNGEALLDQRVEIKTGDIVELIAGATNRYDTILLDIDNGPHAMTDAGNRRLYGRKGMQACRRALREKGCLAVWSAEPNKNFEQLLVTCGFHVSRYRVPAYEGNTSISCFIWVASEDKAALPPGGGEPRMAPSANKRTTPGTSPKHNRNRSGKELCYNHGAGCHHRKNG